MNIPNKHPYILYASYLAAIMVLMDLSSINIALPTIAKALEISVSQVSWILMISMLSASSFALIAGKLSQNYAAKLLFGIGFTSFIIANLLCYFSESLYQLLLIRFVQGIGESLLYVAGPAYIRYHLPNNKQQSAYGIWMACTGIGIASGPLVGGLIIGFAHWSSVFLINIPLGLLGLIFVFKEKSQWVSDQIKRSKTDYLGAIYSFLMLACFIYGINMINHHHLFSSRILVVLGLAVLFLVLFIKREQQAKEPIFELKLFKILNFKLSAIGFFLFFLINVGSRFLRPFYFDNGKGFGPEVSGVLMMISPVLMMIIAPFIKRFSKSVASQSLCFLSNVLLVLSMIMFSFWNANTSLSFIILTMVILGVAMGLYYPSSAYIGMQSVDSKYAGMGSAAISSAKSLGKLSGVLFFAMIYSLLSQMFNAQNDFSYESFKLTFIIAAAIAMIASLISTKIKVI